MTIQPQLVSRMSMMSETTFGEDCSSVILGGAGDLTGHWIPFREDLGATFTTDEDSHDPKTQTQSVREYRKEVRGRRSATLKFTLNFAPTGVAAVSGTSAVQGALGYLLKGILGGEALAQGDTAAAGSTASIVNVNNGSRWAAGKWMGWVNGSGELEWRPVENVSAGVVTLKYGFSGAPANTNVLYNTAVYYMTENPTESFAALVQGADSPDAFLLTGGQCTGLRISIDPSGANMPTIEFTFEFVQWYASDETDDGITGAIADATYTNYNPTVSVEGTLRSQTVGTATAGAESSVDCSALDVKLNLAWQKVTSPRGVNGVKCFRRIKPPGPPVEGSWVEPFETLTRVTAKRSRTDLACWYDFGRVAGGSGIIDVPCTQITSVQRGKSGEQVAGQTVSWKARRDIDVASNVDELAKSPIRIALG